jgi:hypothetical protein
MQMSLINKLNKIEKQTKAQTTISNIKLDVDKSWFITFDTDAL